MKYELNQDKGPKGPKVSDGDYLFKKMKILLTKKYLNKLNKKYQFHQKYHQAAVVVVVIAALVQVLAVAVLAVVVVVEVEKVILSFTYNI